MLQDFSGQIVQAVRVVLGDSTKRYALHEPEFIGNEWHYVKDCIDTRWVSSVGSYVDRFEQALADFTGAKYAVVTCNGTSALHISYLLAGVLPEDEVLMPALTFVATANALSYCGGMAHFVDVESETLGVCPQKLAAYLDSIARVKNGQCINQQTGRVIRALCVVHVFGHPANTGALKMLCEHYHLKLIEDAAEALGSYYQNQHVGHLGCVGVLSFNGNKIITTGGGGAVLTDDAILAQRAKHLTTTAKQAHAFAYWHDEVGYNYRLPNINAALGCAQLEMLLPALIQKRALAHAYQQAFENIKGVRVMHEPPEARSNYWLNALILDSSLVAHRDELLNQLHGAGILCRPLWHPLHQLPMYQQHPRADLSTSESLAVRVINLPSSSHLGKRYEQTQNSCSHLYTS